MCHDFYPYCDILLIVQNLFRDFILVVNCLAIIRDHFQEVLFAVGNVFIVEADIAECVLSSNYSFVGDDLEFVLDGF